MTREVRVIWQFHGNKDKKKERLGITGSVKIISRLVVYNNADIFVALCGIIITRTLTTLLFSP